MCVYVCVHVCVRACVWCACMCVCALVHVPRDRQTQRVIHLLTLGLGDTARDRSQLWEAQHLTALEACTSAQVLGGKGDVPSQEPDCHGKRRDALCVRAARVGLVAEILQGPQYYRQQFIQ